MHRMKGEPVEDRPLDPLSTLRIFEWLHAARQPDEVGHRLRRLLVEQLSR